MTDTRLLLHNIRSVHNVGAIFRTADALGINTIYLSGYTPGPLDRFGAPRKDFAKCSLGAEKAVSSKQIENQIELIRDLKNKGFSIIAVEQSPNSIDYKKYEPGEKVAVIFGSETEGISKDILEMCDVVAEIEMRGQKESLNVSVSAGIVLFRWFD